MFRTSTGSVVNRYLSNRVYILILFFGYSDNPKAEYQNRTGDERLETFSFASKLIPQMRDCSPNASSFTQEVLYDKIEFLSSHRLDSNQQSLLYKSTASPLCYGGNSPDWNRTSNPKVNSFVLCLIELQGITESDVFFTMAISTKHRTLIQLRFYLFQIPKSYLIPRCFFLSWI